MTKFFAIAAATLVVGLVGGTTYAVFLNRPDDPLAQCRGGSVASGQAAIGGAFELVSETGETVTDKDVITKPSLVYFGYTFCPDVCPMDTYRNAEAVDVLAELGYEVQPVFISIDPERDTPEVVAEFTDALHPEMLGLTGSDEQVKQAADAYRAYYARGSGDEEFYLMAHSNFTYLMMPGNELATFFRAEETPEGMAEKSACMINAA